MAPFGRGGGEGPKPMGEPVETSGEPDGWYGLHAGVPEGRDRGATGPKRLKARPGRKVRVVGLEVR